MLERTSFLCHNYVVEVLLLDEERAAFLMTECNSRVFASAPQFSRRVEAGFTAGQVSSDGGALWLRQVDNRINLLRRVAASFTDRGCRCWSSTGLARCSPRS